MTTIGELRALREATREKFDAELLRLVDTGATQVQIARALGITQQAVSGMVRRARTRAGVAA